MSMPSSSSSICRRSTATKHEEFAGDFSKLVLQEIGFVKESFEAVKMKASQKIDEANEIQNQFEELMVMPEERAEERDYKLRQLKIKVSKLRMQVPFKLIAPEEQPHPNIFRWHRLESDLYGDKQIKPDIDYDSPDPPVPYHEIVSILTISNTLDRVDTVACFLFFPKNAVIKRSVLFSLQDTFSNGTGLGYLVEKGLVEVVYKKKSNFTVDGYRMLPSVHSFLRSEESGFRGWADMYVGSCHQVEEKFIYHTPQDFQQLNNNHTRHGKIILHLGKWNNSTEQHIEIINPELFFKHMSKHTELRSVSLRGISMIEELPEFITKLKELKNLDLRACHNLEVIPPSIANLKETLTCLDISECYFLDHMPKALASLKELRILKGFVVGENKDGKSCSLEDLASLHLLEKLNIYTSMKEFPNNSQLGTLSSFPRLRNLTISWGGCSSPNGLDNTRQEEEYERLEEVKACSNLLRVPERVYHRYVFSYLKKLDLQCVPETVTSRWLKPANFENLRKLYIRGGNFFDLHQPLQERKWNVQKLRLKYLCKLNMDWGQLRGSFPKLKCLEMADCPNLDHFPCNNNGIWMKKRKEANEMLRRCAWSNYVY